MQERFTIPFAALELTKATTRELTAAQSGRNKPKI